MQTKAERWWDGPWPWLIYLVFYVVPWLWVWPTAWQLAASAAGLAVFLPTYFISHRLQGSRLFVAATVMLLIGVALAPIGGGWTVFPIYAASEAGRVGPPRRAALAIALVAAVTIATGLLWHQPLFWWATGVLLVIATGGATISRTAFTRVPRRCLPARRRCAASLAPPSASGSPATCTTLLAAR